MRAGFVLILLLPFIAAAIAALIYTFARPFVAWIKDLL